MTSFLEDIIKARNNQENELFAKTLDKFNSNRKKAILEDHMIFVCSTPLSLRICGAEDYKVMISPSYLNKLYKIHHLTDDLILQIANELRCPAFLLRGSDTNPDAIVAISPLKDGDGKPLLIAVSLDKEEEWHKINKISSVYGRTNFYPFINKSTGDQEKGYFNRQIEKGKLIAVNKEKARQCFDSNRLQLPQEETYIGFNNSISYSLANVKGLDEKFLENIKENLAKRYPAPTGRASEENVVDESKNLYSEEQDDFDPMPPAPRLSEIMEGANSINVVDIQRDVILQMYETLKDMPPMTQEQHKDLIAGCKSFLDTNNQIRNDFVGLLQENKRLQTELAEVKTELEETKKLFAEVTAKMNNLLQDGKFEEATEYAAEVAQLDYITSTALPERVNDISQRLADNAVSEQAIRTADYKFKDLVAMIYSSRVYEQDELPPEFIIKLEQSIEKLGYVSETEHEALKLLYDEQTNDLLNTKMELFDATLQIDTLKEINENLTIDNRILDARVLELLDINENKNRAPQKEMTGLSPAKPQMDELDTPADKPNRNNLDKLISSIKDRLSKTPPEKQNDDRGI